MTVILLGTFVVVLSVGVMELSMRGARVQREREQDVRGLYLARTGLNTAFAEIGSGVDTTGFGLGAMGLIDPIVYSDSQGRRIGEFKSLVQPYGTGYEILVVAGVPDLANPEVMNSVRGFVENAGSPFLMPYPGAVSIGGPLRNPLLLFDGPSTTIDGGEKAAFNLSADGYASFMDEFGDLIASGQDPSVLSGGVTSTYEHDTVGTLTLPVTAGESTILTASDLNTYRENFRNAALSMAANADRVITTPVHGDQTWGTAENPEITVIEAGEIQTANVFNGLNQTITGHGTLIVKHTIQPSKNLNLYWTGDIYVIGFSGDGPQLFYNYGTQGTINGNLILLSADDGVNEASLKLKSSSQGANSRPSNLTVNGNLMTLAEAVSNEAEVEVGGTMGDTLTVNGILSMYGSRIEFETKFDSGNNIYINGALALGMAQDLDSGIARSDDFEIEMVGSLSITYDKLLVAQAARALAMLQSDQNLLANVQNPGPGGPELIGRVSGNPRDVEAEIDAIVQASADPYTENFGIIE